MATKKRSKGAGTAASRAKSVARSRAAGGKAKPAAKRTGATTARGAAKPAKAGKPAAAKRATTAAAKPSRAVAKPSRGAAKPSRAVSADNKELAALKSRFQRERSGLEKRLTEAVREIGMLRHHEMRAMQFERQLKERDDLIGRLQHQLEELQRRPAEPIYEREVQQSFSLVVPARDDVDEFEDEAQLVDESQLEDEEV
jgi:hypothetical protein